MPLHVIKIKCLDAFDVHICRIDTSPKSSYDFAEHHHACLLYRLIYSDRSKTLQEEVTKSAILFGEQTNDRLIRSS